MQTLLSLTGWVYTIDGMINEEHQPSQYRPEHPGGDPVFAWSFLEYHPHERGRRWWIVFWILSIGLVAYAGYTKNVLFAVIILIFDVIILFRHYEKPGMLECEVYDHGVIVGARYIPWKHVKKFWIAYDPPHVKRLYFTHSAGFHHLTSISLEDENPIELREFLKQYLVEDLDQEDEHLTDTLSRLLKI